MPCDYCDCHIIDCQCKPIPGRGTSRDPYVIDVCKMQEDCGCLPTLRQAGKDPCILIFDDGHDNITEINLSECAGEGGTSAPSVIRDIGGGTYEHTSGDGTVTLIETGTDPETVTALTVDGSEIVYTDEDGNATRVDVCQIVSDNCASGGSETVTTLTPNADGSLTYVNEAGDSVTYTPPSASETLTSLVSGACGVVTYTDENGGTNAIDFSVAGLKNATAIATATGVRITDGCGNTLDIPITAGGSETLTSATGSCGVLSYRDENNVVNSVDLRGAGLEGVTVSTTATGIRLSDPCGNDIDLPLTGGGDTLTTLTGSCGVITYTDEAGNSNSISVNDGVLDNIGATITATGVRLTDPCGNFIDIPTGGGGSETLTSLSASCAGLAYTDENGTTNTISLPPNGMDGVVVTNTATGVRLTDGCGDFVDIPITSGGETLTSISHSCGTLTYTDENGTPNTLDLGGNGLDGITVGSAPGGGTRLTDSCSNFIDLPAAAGETLTSLAPGASCETINYTDEAGNISIIDIGGAGLAGATVTAIPGGGTIITDACGNSVLIPGTDAAPKIRQIVQACEEADPTTLSPGINDVLPQVFCPGEGTIEEACVTGVDNGMNGTVVIGIIVNGAYTGQDITINPAGLDAPFAECADLADISLPAGGPNTVSWFVVGGTATSGFPDSITLDAIGTCA